ncbi:MAG: GNAT family N-acetyltransferase [Bacteroidota bacterium]
MFEGPIPVIETARLLLRQFNTEDASRVKKLAGEEDVARNTLAMPFPYLDGMAEAWIGTHVNDFHEGKSVIWAITLNDSTLLIGAIGLSLQLPYMLAEMGYWIGREYWNQGYCTEAVRAALDYGLNQLKLHKVTASHFGNNPASGRVMQKAGMTYEGTLRSHMLHWNEYKDLVYYGIIREENSSVSG